MANTGRFNSEMKIYSLIFKSDDNAIRYGGNLIIISVFIIMMQISTFFMIQSWSKGSHLNRIFERFSVLVKDVPEMMEVVNWVYQ